MAFKDYSAIPSENTNLSDGTYIGPDMFRNDVRPALQQLAANGKEVAMEVNALVSGPATAAFSHATDYAEGTTAAKLRQTISVKDPPFNAKGDGVTDDRAAIAAAVAAARGKRLVFPEGNYLINTDGGSIVLEEVTLEGEGVLDGATGSLDRGVNLYITGTGNSPFLIRRGVSISGLGWYYPNQPDSATPTPHAATLDFDMSDGAVQFVSIQRNVVYNAWNFIRCIDFGGNLGHIEISNNYICALNIGVFFEHNVEHVRINCNNFTFGHWLQATEAGARAYMRANAIAIKSDKSDGIEIVDNLVFGQLRGVMMGENGLCQFMKIVNNKIDQVRYGIQAIGAGNFGGVIANNTFNCYNPVDTTLQGRSVSIETQGAERESIVINANEFLTATENHIFTTSTATRSVVIGPQNYRGWAVGKTTGAHGAIFANGANTNITVNGGWFDGLVNTPRSVGIRGSCNTLQITGATFNLCQQAIESSASAIQVTGNRSFATAGTSALALTGTTTSFGNAWDKP